MSNSTNSTSSRRCITIEQFKAELQAQGVPREHLAVKCVQCGTVQSRQDFIDAGVHRTMQEAQKHWGFSCIGRFVSNTGCDWTLGGLFQIHQLEIDFGDGSNPMPIFEPSTPEEAQAHSENR